MVATRILKRSIRWDPYRTPPAIPNHLFSIHFWKYSTSFPVYFAITSILLVCFVLRCIFSFIVRWQSLRAHNQLNVFSICNVRWLCIPFFPSPHKQLYCFNYLLRLTCTKHNAHSPSLSHVSLPHPAKYKLVQHIFYQSAFCARNMNSFLLFTIFTLLFFGLSLSLALCLSLSFFLSLPPPNEPSFSLSGPISLPLSLCIFDLFYTRCLAYFWCTFWSFFLPTKSSSADRRKHFWQQSQSKRERCVMGKSKSIVLHMNPESMENTIFDEQERSRELSA